MKKPAIDICRVYGLPADEGGARFLVDRLWPRGVKKDALRVDGWLKDVAPSSALRTWFGHDPQRWDEFQHRYEAELDANPAAWKPLLDAASRGPVTLLFAAHDPEHNNAVVLRDYILRALRSRDGRRS
ncbi:hypothetical protein A6V36_32545 [Paraburkholderia ginsengiterrae]|uniref:MarR family transcriptional regulator n=1 Tax=Paraburkholderia ginsengiterrae TaxID=1462993 RepID=A0A1A9N3B9_9BURK|nr:DUF488 domain-containing protein [Paraburkholderia ginsengiterrae]OAJ56920.1 hypothetical protein A6V37_30525 [Paraburkholderia ginsengiterrae]OAJ56976.1 hypothetical protein A6V36_32545 [Paraburkholderia ginsengiterrae]